MRTRLYLDVDGVINKFSGAVGGHEKHVIDGFTLRIYPDKVKAFMEMFDEVVWATTWVLHPEMLALLEGVIGVESLGVIPVTQDELEVGMLIQRSTGKGPAVARHFDADPLEPGATLWIDDMLGPEDYAIGNERGITLHTPDPEVGAYPFIDNLLDGNVSWAQYVKEQSCLTSN
jgi:hypothetical protein